MILLDWFMLFLPLVAFFDVVVFLFKEIVLFLGVICCNKMLSAVNLGLQSVYLSSRTFSTFSLYLEELSTTI
jgi:hypothetical protein